MKHIRSVTVLGAGTMGSQIAAHTANAGIPTLLLDLDAKTAANGLARARKLKPDPFFTKHTHRTITVGGFDSHLAQVAESDWIVEAVVEQLAVKQELLRKVEQYRAQDTIVSSNTSGIPIATISEGFSDNFRQHWLGTHFFNPPRYLPLLEVIPTTDTKPEVLKTMVEFGDRALGKGVVVAKDTPNFIGNRIGLYGVMRVLEQLVNGKYTIEEIDAMTGPLLGRAKSATFRTLDIAGIDILTHVMNNLVTQLETDEERAAFELPPLIQDLNARGWHGQKTGQGFYQKMRTESGTEIVTLDPQTMKYRARTRPQLPALDNAQSIDDLGTRIRT
ncbi:MAG TPA: 3-hydroxyacyl-CoA dehydrogenase family protein, partial [Acidobacteria bacterium]|nr:3-hydroxyacyl-CoA dehydrogenase family protein [Acidobacteriota bacterium]